ncbi:ArsR/SmtB family transcription factor [Deinococcus proteolyticus]|nr:helix-turn-helix domain-containing protein [Deinococcus proteolyticus]
MLLSPTYRSIIKQLFLRPISLTQLAEELGSKMDSVYYKVKKLESMGLACVAYEQTRRGKSVKYYSMTAERYEVPFNNTNNDTIEDLIVSQMTSRQEAFAKSLVNNINTNLGTSEGNPSVIVELLNGVLHTHLKATPSMEEDSTIIYWHPVFLRPKDTPSYFNEIMEITKRYSDKGLPSERIEHILGIQLVLKND